MGPTQRLAPEAFLGALLGALEGTSDAVSLTDQAGIVQFANPAAARFLGRPGQDLSGLAVWELQPGMDAARWQANWLLVEQRGTLRAESLTPASLGPQRVIEAMSVLVGEGARRLCFTQMRDVTETHRAAADRRFLGALVEAMQEAVVSVDLEHRVSSWSPGAEALYGWTAAEVLGRPLLPLIAPDITPSEVEALTRQLVTEGTLVRNGLHTCKGGRTVAVRLSGSTLLNAAGQPVGLLMVARDETARLAGEADLAASQRQLADAVTAAGLGRWEWDLETGAISIGEENRGLGVGIHQPAPGEALPAYAQRITHPEDVERMQAHLEFHLAGQSPRIDVECRVATEAGGWRWVRVLGQVVRRGPDGAPAGVSGFLLDAQAQHDAHDRELEVTRLSADVSALRDLLPICAWCKKVRDDHGYWDQLDQYVAAHTATRFSHSICPECAEKQFGSGGSGGPATTG